jgi:hypothetical protein
MSKPFGVLQVAEVATLVFPGVTQENRGQKASQLFSSTSAAGATEPRVTSRENTKTGHRPDGDE